MSAHTQLLSILICLLLCTKFSCNFSTELIHKNYMHLLRVQLSGGGGQAGSWITIFTKHETVHIFSDFLLPGCCYED